MDILAMNSPHVAIFPFPAQGHVNSMLKLAQLLSLSNFKISFLVTVDTHNRLLNHTDVLSRFGSEFELQSLPDGISLHGVNTRDGISKLYDSLNLIGKPFLREFLARERCSKSPVTCVIADGILSMAADVAEEINLPIIYFRTASACSFWTYFCIPELLQAGELPLKENGMDFTVTKVKGMEDFLRGRDLPSFCRVSDLTSPDFRIVLDETRQTPRAWGLILNTFEDLEGPILSQIRTVCPNVYTIGPIHAHLKARLATKSTSTNSLWKEDESCMNWLDTQPPKSVIYVSFGSIAGLTSEELLEFWYGLVNSDQRFLWVMRPDLIVGQEGKDQIPEELKQSTKARGYMADWVPQEKVLAHTAIGGFLTHSGWNSTIESIVEGVPMICWPRFADQQVNSRFVGEVWKMGLDIKDTCDRVIVEKSIKDLMENRKGEFLQRTNQMASLSRIAVNEEDAMDLKLSKVKGMEDFLRDLPSFCRMSDLANNPSFRLLFTELLAQRPTQEPNNMDSKEVDDNIELDENEEHVTSNDEDETSSASRDDDESSKASSEGDASSEKSGNESESSENNTLLVPECENVDRPIALWSA